MLDDLRNSATRTHKVGTRSYGEEEEALSTRSARKGYTYESERQPFLGMTAPQRFVIVLMLFLMTCVLGSFCLILTERIVPPLF